MQLDVSVSIVAVGFCAKEKVHTPPPFFTIANVTFADDLPPPPPFPPPHVYDLCPFCKPSNIERTVFLSQALIRLI